MAIKTLIDIASLAITAKVAKETIKSARGLEKKAKKVSKKANKKKRVNSDLQFFNL